MADDQPPQQPNERDPLVRQQGANQIPWKKAAVVTVLAAVVVVVVLATLLAVSVAGLSVAEEVKGTSKVAQGNQFTTYERFGSSGCPDKDGVSTIYEGVTVGYNQSLASTISNFKCFPIGRQNSYNEEIAYYNETFSRFVPIPGVVPHYPNVTEYLTFRVGRNHHDVPCALCSVEQRTAIQVIPSSYECPPAWTLEYNGYLMTDVSHTVFVCVDIQMDVLHESELPTPYAPTLGHVIAEKLLHTDVYKQGYVLSCAVCSR